MDERLRHTSDIQNRHIKRQNQRRRAMKRRRIVFFTVLILIFVSIILFFTPLFNIKQINIAGNTKIETAQLKQAVGSVEEENLFLLNTKKIITNIKTIPYIDSVEIKKKLFPTGINVNVYECIPIGFIPYNGQFIILDKNLKVLEICDSVYENLCEISGIGVTAASPGAVLSADDSEKLASVIDCTARLIEHDIHNKIGVINFADMNNITFTYENRLDVVCGSVVDFQKKIGMFKKAVNSSKLTANSRGTIDISIFGKAIYTP